MIFSKWCRLLPGMLVLLGGCQLAAAPGPVRSVEELETRLRNARGGETILVQDGDYRDVRLSGQGSKPLPVFIRPVTIRAAGRDVRFLGSTRLTDVSGLIFDGISFGFPDATGQRDMVLSLVRATQVRILNARVTGAITPAGHMGKGINVSQSRDIEVSDSDISEAHRGIVLDRAERVVVRRNRLHDLGSDGIDLAGSSNVLVADNHMWGFNPLGADHSDGIQGFSAGQENGLRDIAITGNLIEGHVVNGSGLRTQGIFIRSERAKDGIRHSAIRITKNIITDPSFHGITVNNADGLEILDNRVLWARDVVREPKARWAWIMVTDSRNATVEGNVTPKLLPKQDGVWRDNREMMVTQAEVAASVREWRDKAERR